MHPPGALHHAVRNSEAEKGEPQLQNKRGELLFQEVPQMKAKKILSLMLALVMALALAAPAMAKKDKGSKDKPAGPAVAAVDVDKIEEEPRLSLIENGAKIDTGKYSAIYIKQANDIAIIVQRDDLRSDEEIIAEARASDKSLDKDGKGAITVIRGDGMVWLHKNRTTLVDVTGGILIVLGPISHIGFVGGDAPTEDELRPDDGTVSAVFQITKFLNELGTPGAGFTFEVVDAEGKVVGEMTSNEQGVAATSGLEVAPGQYTIRETGLDFSAYEAVEDIVVTVDENGQVIYPEDEYGVDRDYIVNYQLGALEVTAPTVMQKYDEVWHELMYAEAEADTRVSYISDLPSYITPKKFNNGFTYLVINKDALANDPDGATIRIAKSDPSNTLFPDIAPANPWDDPIPLTYNLRVEGNELVVTSNLPNFRVRMVTANPTHKDLFTGGHEGTSCEPRSYTIPELASDGTFCFGIHYDCPGYTTSTITGCEPTTEIRRECEKIYDGEVTIAVTNAAGEVVDAAGKLPRGAYTVTVTAGEEVLSTKTVTVKPGQIASVSFDTLTMTEMGADVLKCPVCVDYNP